MSSEERNLLGSEASDTGSDTDLVVEQYLAPTVRRGRFAAVITGTLLVAATVAAALATAPHARSLRMAPLGFGPDDGVVTLVEETEEKDATDATEATEETEKEQEDSADDESKDKADEETEPGHEVVDTKMHKMDCSKFPFLRLVNMTHRNLGGQGPDSGETGLIYSTRVEGGERDGEEFELHLNVTSPEEDFHPQSASETGFQGKYGSINIKAGTNVTIEIEKYDPKTQKHIPFGDFYFTFFDLDQGPDGEASESIILNHFSRAFIANHSEVAVHKTFDGRLVLKATKEGTGADNPKNPLALTKQQFRKAVTVAVKGSDKLVVTFRVGHSKTDNPRWFNFRGQPTLLCAARSDTHAHMPLQEFRDGSSSGRLGGLVVLLAAFLAGSSLRQPFA